MATRHPQDPGLRLSAAALLLVNLVPLFGVLVLGWQVLPLLFLYWCENAVVGAFNVARMLTVAPGPSARGSQKLTFALLFTLHYGFFTFLHLLVLLAVFGPRESFGMLPDARGLLELVRTHHLQWALLGLVVSHGCSFFANHLGRGERFRVTLHELMVQPYRRLMVLHVALIAGGGLVSFLGAPVGGLVALVALKIALDLHAHLRERTRDAEPG